MLSFGDKLREQRLLLRLSQSSLASIGGIKKNAQYKYEKGIQLPSLDYLLKIAAAGVDLHYLLFDEQRSDSRGDVVKVTVHEDRGVEEGKTVSMPFDWFLEQGIKTQNLEAVIVPGDTMAPWYSKGDIVIVDTTEQTLNGSAMAIRIDGVLYVNNFFMQPNRILQVCCLNSHYQNYCIDTSNLNITVIGVIVAVLKKFKGQPGVSRM